MEIYAGTKQFPPDSKATRIRAYQLYEEALAEKNRSKGEQPRSAELARDAERNGLPAFPRAVGDDLLDVKV